MAIRQLPSAKLCGERGSLAPIYIGVRKIERLVAVASYNGGEERAATSASCVQDVWLSQICPQTSKIRGWTVLPYRSVRTDGSASNFNGCATLTCTLSALQASACELICTVRTVVEFR